MELRAVHKHLLNHFSSSLFRTPWNWIKTTRKFERVRHQVRFLLDCRAQRVVPRFISNSVQTNLIVSGRRAAVKRERYMFSTLSDVIREKKQYECRLRDMMMEWRADMRLYSKSDYLWCRTLMEQVVAFERQSCIERLGRKLRDLVQFSGRQCSGQRGNTRQTQHLSISSTEGATTLDPSNICR